MLLQGWESLTRIRSGRVALLLRSLLVLGDFLLVILDHLARELPIEGLTRELAEVRVHRLLVFVGFRRRVHTELCRDRRRLLRPSGVVLLERLPLEASENHLGTRPSPGARFCPSGQAIPANCRSPRSVTSAMPVFVAVLRN